MRRRPAGLSIDERSGVISGTPRTARGPETFVVSATGVGVRVTYPLVLSVTEPPHGLSYMSPVTATVGMALAPLRPSISGPADHYAVSPTLPRGILLDSSSGILSGTPTEASGLAPYTVTANSLAGNTRFILLLTVKPASSDAIPRHGPARRGPGSRPGPAPSFPESSGRWDGIFGKHSCKRSAHARQVPRWQKMKRGIPSGDAVWGAFACRARPGGRHRALSSAVRIYHQRGAKMKSPIRKLARCGCAAACLQIDSNTAIAFDRAHSGNTSDITFPGRAAVYFTHSTPHGQQRSIPRTGCKCTAIRGGSGPMSSANAGRTPMRAKLLRKAVLLLALSMAGAGIALASNTSWFAADTAYGTNGVSEALTSTSYGRANAVDHNDVNHRVYSLVAAHPSDFNGYVGPFTLTRRLSSGAIDTAFGASGVTTTFANYNDPHLVNAFDALCIDPVTHGLVLAGEGKGSGVIVERLLPPDANGVAALDTSFNPNGGTPGVVTWTKSRPSLNVRPRGCTVLGDRSIFVAGPDGSAPSRLAMNMVSADGDPSGFTFFCRPGVVTPNGDSWEGGSIEWNSSQAINPNLIMVGTVSHNAVLYAVDPCTGAGDANFNGDGFLSVPAIDGHLYSDPLVGAVHGDGSILLALLASDTLNADLVGWNYPVM